MHSNRGPGPDSGVVNSSVSSNSSLPKRRSRCKRTESISVSTELVISKNSRCCPKGRGHSRSTSPKMDSPPCSECGRKFWSLKALYGHYRCHPERPWRGMNRPPHMAEAPSLMMIADVVDSVNESGGENEKDKKAEDVVMADKKGEDCNPCVSIITSCQTEGPCVEECSLRKDAPPTHGQGTSAIVGETDRVKKGRLDIDLNKLPREVDDPDSPTSCCIPFLGI